MEIRFSMAVLVAMGLVLANAYITKIIYKKVECETDPSVAVAPICQLKPVKRDVKNVTLGVTLLKPASKIFVHLKNFQKTNTNHFMPGFIDITQDYCQVANQTSPAAAFAISTLKRLSPNVYKMYMDNVYYCPLKAEPMFVSTIFVSNITDQPFIPPGEYKVIYRFFNENNKTLYKLSLYTIRQDKNPRSYRN